MSCWKRNLMLLPLLLSLPGCGGYYTHDVYFGPEKSGGWSIPWDNNKASSFSCSGRTVIFPSSAVSSKKTAEGVLGVPVLPASAIIMEENQREALSFVLEYRDVLPAICSTSDVRIFAGHDISEVKPVTAVMAYKVAENEYYCKYNFGMKQASVTDFSLKVSTEKIGCPSPLLKVKLTSGYQYQFSPW